MKIKIQVLLALSLSSIIDALSVAAIDSACGGFGNEIVCFGGSSGNITYTDTVYTYVYSLDVSKGGTILELSNGWKLIEYSSDHNEIEARNLFQSAVISNTQLLVSGGISASEDPLLNQTLVYDVKTKSWTSYAPYVEGVYGNRLINRASSAVVPGKGVAFYGGTEYGINPEWTTDLIENSTLLTGANGDVRLAGYTSVTYLDINNTTNPWYTPPQNNVPRIFPAIQTSIYHEKDKRIYFLGGLFTDTEGPNFFPETVTKINSTFPLSYALYFDTETNTWGNQTLTGSDIPSPRQFFTLTLLPNNPDTVILYGGSNRVDISLEPCYTLNLTSFTWTIQNLNPTTPFGTADLSRALHSAILINETLFIVNGINSKHISEGIIYALNVSDADNISFLHTLPPLAEGSGVKPNVTSGDSKSGDDKKSEDGKLSTGAIVGIVLAILALVIIAAIIAWFFYRRYKKDEKIRKETEEELNNAEVELGFDEVKDPTYIELSESDDHPNRTVKTAVKPFGHETVVVEENTTTTTNSATKTVPDGQSIQTTVKTFSNGNVVFEEVSTIRTTTTPNVADKVVPDVTQVIKADGADR